MQQWHDCKKEAGDAVLLFRLGDFYEAFYEDAERLARDLGVTLTKRQEVPMAGVPFHAAESYIEKLVRKGHLVAIAEQLENPKNVKGIVKRGVTRIVSPATLLTDSYLKEKESNYFCSIAKLNATWAFARLEISTGRFEVAEYESEKPLLDELYKSRPTELLLQEKAEKELESSLSELSLSFPVKILVKENWHFDHKLSFDLLTNHFTVHSLDGFGLKGMVCAMNAAAVLLSHIQDTLSLSLQHVSRITPLHVNNTMSIDRATQRNLELLTPMHPGSKNTLFDLLDETTTPMGARLLAELILRPLTSKEQIERRLNAVEESVASPQKMTPLLEKLSHIKDIERLITRVTTGLCSPRDLTALRFSLEALPDILQGMNGFTADIFTDITKLLSQQTPTKAIAHTLVDEPPLRLTDGYVIREGVDEQLDTLKKLKREAQWFLTEYQDTLKREFDIKTLKVGYSKAFGYFIEVSKGQASRMPDSFERRQTLVNAERFISPELKEFEHKILTADEKIAEKEHDLFEQVKKTVASFSDSIMTIARGIAQLDCLLSFALAAKKGGYTRPKFQETPGIVIEKGRHPIVERTIERHSFIPNDTTLNHDNQSLMLITGPNMAGKSTYIRQVALLTIMAHMGSFVPAASSCFGIVDKVFSRIGASDDLSRGQSTFMVEMAETANILHNATERSLVILDEIGRGTSTYDGIAIAWAVAEYLLSAHTLPVMTLFATHYSELTLLEEKFSPVKNYQVAVQETAESIVFLHRILPGGTDKSYGIHVASLAGLPQKAIRMAKEKLFTLEQCAPPSLGEEQLTLFAAPAKTPLEEHLRTINPDELTAKEALDILYKLKGMQES